MIRTRGPYLPKIVLYQLSHTPIRCFNQQQKVLYNNHKRNASTFSKILYAEGKGTFPARFLSLGLRQSRLAGFPSDLHQSLLAGCPSGFQQHLAAEPLDLHQPHLAGDLPWCFHPVKLYEVALFIVVDFKDSAFPEDGMLNPRSCLMQVELHCALEVP